MMHNQSDPQNYTDLLTAVLSFLAVNLLWIFFALWLLYGLVPVLLLSVVIHHMINRLEVRLLQSASQIPQGYAPLSPPYNRNR